MRGDLDRGKIARQYADGTTSAELAEEHGCSQSTIVRVVRKARQQPQEKDTQGDEARIGVELPRGGSIMLTIHDKGKMLGTFRLTTAGMAYYPPRQKVRPNGLVTYDRLAEAQRLLSG